MESTVLFVTGMHRSGTSAVAGSLQRLGVYLGPQRDLMPANQSNARGYYEHLEAVAVNDALLHRFSGDWASTASFPRDWQKHPAARLQKSRAKQLLQNLRMNVLPGGHVMALKDPRFCRTLPLWVTAARELRLEPAVLEVARHHQAAAESLSKREHWGVGESLDLGNSYRFDLRQHLMADMALEHAVVQFEAVLGDWRHELGGAMSSLVEDFNWSLEQDGDVDGFLSMGMVHHGAA